MTKAKLSEQITLVSRREASEILGVGPATIYRYERAGLLTPIRLNSRVTRYRADELRKFVEKHSEISNEKGD